AADLRRDRETWTEILKRVRAFGESAGNQTFFVGAGAFVRGPRQRGRSTVPRKRRSGEFLEQIDVRILAEAFDQLPDLSNCAGRVLEVLGIEFHTRVEEQRPVHPGGRAFQVGSHPLVASILEVTETLVVHEDRVPAQAEVGAVRPRLD